jgi:hypothetical protein
MVFPYIHFHVHIHIYGNVYMEKLRYLTFYIVFLPAVINITLPEIFC